MLVQTMQVFAETVTMTIVVALYYVLVTFICNFFEIVEWVTSHLQVTDKCCKI